MIDGINDEIANKTILFGAKNLKAFKEKMKAYEDIRKRSQGKSTHQEKSGKKKEAGVKTESKDGKLQRCYNCGGRGHESKNCPFKDKSRRCFNCNQFGHESKNCTTKVTNDDSGKSKKSMTFCKVKPYNRHEKEVEINGVKIDSLIDTGAQVCLLRKSVYVKLKLSTDYKRESCCVIGVGQLGTESLGFFQTVIEVDQDKFPTTIYLVPDDALDYDLIIGNEIIHQANLEGGIDCGKFKKIMPTVFLSRIEV